MFFLFSYGKGFCFLSVMRVMNEWSEGQMGERKRGYMSYGNEEMMDMYIDEDTKDE